MANTSVSKASCSCRDESGGRSSYLVTARRKPPPPLRCLGASRRPRWCPSASTRLWSSGLQLSPRRLCSRGSVSWRSTPVSPRRRAIAAPRRVVRTERSLVKFSSDPGSGIKALGEPDLTVIQQRPGGREPARAGDDAPQSRFENAERGSSHAVDGRWYGAGGLKPGSRLILGFFKARRTVVGVAYSLRA